MKESEAIEYMLSLQGGSIKPGLDRIEKLLDLLGNPQEDLKFIHIAGTNGKGSTLAFISEILSESGYRVGRYISPAISSYREKIQVNGKSISTAKLIDGAEIIKTNIVQMVNDGLESPSSFEAETALALWYYKEKKCDYVVIETGMGGLLDATNVIPTPLVCVLASISYDHMGFLGDTLEAIARQKAGIIKPGCAVVSAVQLSDAEKVITETARINNCSLNYVNLDKLVDKSEADYSSIKKLQQFTYKEYKRLSVSMLGKYQLQNAALAIEAIDALKAKGIKVSDDAIRSGLKKATQPGRFQVVSDKPLIILDGAHNEGAAIRLAETIDFYFTNKRIIYIMGVLKDKEYEKVSALTADRAECIFTITPPGNPRALGALELAQTVSKYNKKVTSSDSVEEALEMARLIAGDDGVIIAFGSLSYLGKMLELVKNGSGKNKRSR